MKNIFCGFFFAVFMLLDSCSVPHKSNIVAPDCDSIVYEGRVVVSPDSAVYQYPGTTIRLCFSGSSISALLKPNAGYYNVSVDSLPAFKLSTYCDACSADDVSTFVLADSLTPGFHNVELTLVNEGLFCHPAFFGFVLSSADCVVKKPVARRHTIEFIGNSVTCAYGVEAQSQNDHFADSTENFMFSYANLTAKAFDASAMVVARSGIGIYRNYNDTVTGSEHPMPSFYENIFIDSRDYWNFTSFSPEIVCINLGTNDFSAGEYDVNKFCEADIDFVGTVRKHYPKAKIILLSGGMLVGKRYEDCNNAINHVAYVHRSSGDTNIYRFQFSRHKPEFGYGADWHPSLRYQEQMSRELINFIESISDWKVVK